VRHAKTLAFAVVGLVGLFQLCRPASPRCFSKHVSECDVRATFISAPKEPPLQMPAAPVSMVC